MNCRLPVILPPAPDELLSSWISRHAAFYGVTPIAMLRHCRSEAASLRAVDLCLTTDQSRRLAKMFSTDSRTVRRMTFERATRPMHRLIAKGPIQSCARCTPSTHGPVPIRRSRLQGWRITCPTWAMRSAMEPARNTAKPWNLIAMPPFRAKNCCTTKPNAASRLGVRR